MNSMCIKRRRLSLPSQSYIFERPVAQVKTFDGRSSLISNEPTTREVWRAMRRDLSDVGLHLQTIMLHYHPFLQVPEDGSEFHRNLFTTIPTKRGMFVSDEDIAEIFRLKLSTVDSPPFGSDTQAFYYLRSLAMTVGQLKKIIAHWVSNGQQFDEAEVWMEAIRTSPSVDDATIIYIRYIGMSERRNRSQRISAYDRVEEDMRGRRYGVLRAFEESFKYLFPNHTNAWKVYEFVDAEIRYFPKRKSENPLGTNPELGRSGLISQVVQDRERILIQYFGFPMLLNRQRGGFHASYVIRSKESAVYCRTRPTFFEQLSRRPTSPTMEVMARIEDWIQKVVKFAQANWLYIDPRTYPLTAALQRLYVDQATPTQHDGITILALLGENITLEHFRDVHPFFGGNSRAGCLTYSLLKQLQEVEIAFGTEPVPFSTSSFPFVNLWPWRPARNAKMFQISDAAKLLKSYVIAVEPWIVVSFSASVFSLVTTQFEGRDSTKYFISWHC